eukprot:c6819_g1_i1.p1 GENE.c6819_g1_i1~~c6819_g1_i1.p1  ORF type:complete len:368 (-),score=78.66 c6819_g1_i1:246-1274(-)
MEMLRNKPKTLKDIIFDDDEYEFDQSDLTVLCTTTRSPRYGHSNSRHKGIAMAQQQPNELLASHPTPSSIAEWEQDDHDTMCILDEDASCAETTDSFTMDPAPIRLTPKQLTPPIALSPSSILELFDAFDRKASGTVSVAPLSSIVHTMLQNPQQNKIFGQSVLHAVFLSKIRAELDIIQRTSDPSSTQATRSVTMNPHSFNLSRIEFFNVIVRAVTETLFHADSLPPTSSCTRADTFTTLPWDPESSLEQITNKVFQFWKSQSASLSNQRGSSSNSITISSPLLSPRGSPSPSRPTSKPQPRRHTSSLNPSSVSWCSDGNMFALRTPPAMSRWSHPSAIHA